MVTKIDVKRQYNYTSSSIRPMEVMEYFPLRIDIKNSILKKVEFSAPPPLTI